MKPRQNEFAIKIIDETIENIDTATERNVKVKAGDIVGVGYSYWRYAITQQHRFDVYVAFDEGKEEVKEEKEEEIKEDIKPEEKEATPAPIVEEKSIEKLKKKAKNKPTNKSKKSKK